MAQPGGQAPASTAVPSVGNLVRQDEAWKKALEAAANTTGKPVAVLLNNPAHPRDVSAYLESLKEARKQSRFSRTCRAVAACIDAITRHEKALDMFAQAGGMPGCLIWGCIKFALELSYGYSKDFERMVNTMAHITRWLEPVFIEANTFQDSAMVSQCLLELYAHIATFWTKCLEFFSASKSRRVYSAFSAVWTDYTAEYETLQANMDRSIKILLTAAAAEHHRQFKEFDKKLGRLAISERQLVRQRDIAHWLAPPEDVTYGNDFHVTDLAGQCSARFGDTCEWITDDHQYRTWSTSTSGSALWVESGPGAGKTVLASYMIIHQLTVSNRRCFYYFFKGTDSYRATPLAGAKCLLSQIYMFCQREHLDMATEFEVLSAAVIEDGHARSKSFEKTWGIFVSFASFIGGCKVIIDGLDECLQPRLFLDSLLASSTRCSMSIALTCRSSTVNIDGIGTIVVLSLGSSHYGDLENYIAHKASNLPVHVPSEVRATVVERLAGKHNGMFLWVALVFEELESAVTLDELKRALEDLPDGLDEIYRRIIRNLDKKLKKAQRRLCQKILVWLHACRRPLQLDWLYEALEFEYRGEGFLFTRQDFADAIKAACGPLVVVKGDEVALVHFTLKQFLEGFAETNSAPAEFRVEAKEAHQHLLQVALAYMTSMQVVEQPNAPGWSKSTGQPTVGFDLTRHRLAGYCASHWMAHMRATRMSPEAFEALSKFADAPSSLAWVYLVLRLDELSLETVFWDLESLIEALESHQKRQPERMNALAISHDWCVLTRYILFEYGDALQKDPSLLLGISFSSLATRRALFPNIAWIRENDGDPSCHILPDPFHVRHAIEIPCHRQLRGHVSSLEGTKLPPFYRVPDSLGLFHNHSKLGAFIFADYYLLDKPQLWIQDVRSGKQLRPVTIEAFSEIERCASTNGHYSCDDEPVLLDAAVSPDEHMVACVYGMKSGHNYFTCVWELRQDTNFERDIDDDDWARVIFQAESHQVLFDGSAAHVIFGDDSTYLWCPAGRIELRTGVATPFSVVDLPKLPQEANGLCTTSLSFYGAGESIIVSRDRYVGPNGRDFAGYRYSSLGARLAEIKKPDLTALARSRRRVSMSEILRLDPSGRFIMCSFITGKFQGVALEDTLTGTTVKLQQSLAYPQRQIIFVPEAKLAVFSTYISDRLDLEITTWDLSSDTEEPRKLASRSFRDNLCGLCVSKAGDLLFMVTSNRIVSRLTLPDLEEHDQPLGFRGHPRDDIKFLMSPNGAEFCSMLASPTG